MKKEQILKTIESKKSEIHALGIKSVGLFGSYVRNESTGSSDIDLLVDFEANQENFDNFMAVCDLFEKLFKHHRIEVVTKSGLSPYIGPNILREVEYV